MEIVNRLRSQAVGVIDHAPIQWTGASQVSVVVAGLVIMVQPVIAQDSAFEEAADVACDGALGQAIFLGFGLLTLVLILAGLGQIAMGFLSLGRGGGGMGRQRKRNSVINGALTLLGGLFLGSMGALLDYLGVNVDNCLSGDILIITPLFM